MTVAGRSRDSADKFPSSSWRRHWSPVSICLVWQIWTAASQLCLVWIFTFHFFFFFKSLFQFSVRLSLSLFSLSSSSVLPFLVSSSFWWINNDGRKNGEKEEEENDDSFEILCSISFQVFKFYLKLFWGEGGLIFGGIPQVLSRFFAPFETVLIPKKIQFTIFSLFFFQIVRSIQTLSSIE